MPNQNILVSKFRVRMVNIMLSLIEVSCYHSKTDLSLTKSALYLSDGEFYSLSLGLPLHNVYLLEEYYTYHTYFQN